MHKIIFNLLLVFCLSPAVNAATDLKTLFSEMEAQQKGKLRGPFGANMLQFKNRRKPVRQLTDADGSYMFQAAERNAKAQQLIDEHGFYTGNLFTLNYYQLMGEIVYGNALGNHALDHKGMLSKGASYLNKTVNILNHWVLEKYYKSQYTSSGIAKGFSKRGAAGSEFEQKYAVYFFNFYLSLYEDVYQYLPAYMLAKQSPIANSAGLDQARKLIEQSYDYFAAVWGTRDRRVRDLYVIRNAIHNNLSEDVLSKIEVFLAANPWYARDGHTYLQKIHKILTAYFNADVGKLITQAKKLGLDDIAAACEQIQVNGPSAANLKFFSDLLAKLTQEKMGTPTEKKAEKLSFTIQSADYVGKEVLNLGGGVDSTDKALVLVNLAYTEGFLITDNYLYFYNEISDSDTDTAEETLGMVIGIASDTLDEAFSDTLETWNDVTGNKLSQFYDDTLKSSAINTLSLVLDQ